MIGILLILFIIPKVNQISKKLSSLINISSRYISMFIYSLLICVLGLVIYYLAIPTFKKKVIPFIRKYIDKRLSQIDQ